MFVLAEMKDTVKVHPRIFKIKLNDAIAETLNKKFANKVVHNLGLCISLWDIQKIEESFIFPGDGSSHTIVHFRFVVFRPFMDEIICAKIRSSSKEGVLGLLKRHKKKEHDQASICTHCTKSFTSLQDLELHLRIAHDKFQCVHCHKDFLSHRILEQHKAFVHGEVGEVSPGQQAPVHQESLKRGGGGGKALKQVKTTPPQNPIKPQSKTTPIDLTKPEASGEKSPSLEYSCPHCKVVMISAQLLQQHMEVVHKKKCEGYDFPCVQCGTSFKFKEELKKHAYLSHGIQWKDFNLQCPHCKGTFATSQTLERHIRRIHDNSKPFRCSQCKRTYTSEQDLQRHVRQEHVDQRPFTCELCAQGFKRKYQWRDHLLSAHNMALCKICLHVYRNEAELEQHMSIAHKDHEIVLCTLCRTPFYTADQLLRHLHTHNTSATKDAFPCRACRSSFSLSEALDLHIKHKHHLKCPVCDKHFDRRDNLRSHQKNMQHFLQQD